MTLSALIKPVRLSTDPVKAFVGVAALIVAVLLGLAIAFPEEAGGALQVWIGSRTYNHCFLVLPIALYMLWMRQGRVASETATPNWWAFGAIAVVSLGWSVLSVLSVLELQQFAVLTLFQLILLGCLGWPLYRKLLAPLLYLYFLVPSGDFLTQPLQDFTAGFAVAGLRMLGIPVYSNGAVMEVPSGTFAVAEACAGLRFLIATVVLGVFFACEMYRSHVRRWIYVALCIAVPVIGNGFRALGIILASEYFNNAAAVEADHITYGFVFFSLVLIILIAIGFAFSDLKGVQEEAVAAPAAPAGEDAPWSLAGVVLAALVVASIGRLFFLFAGQAIDTGSPSSAPAVASSWKNAPPSNPAWTPVIHDTSSSFLDAKSDGTHTVYRFVGIFAHRDRNTKLIRSDNRLLDEKHWQYSAREHVSLHIQGHLVHVDAITIISDNIRRLVVSFYGVDGQPTASLWRVKLSHLTAVLGRRGCTPAYFALAVDYDAGDHPADVIQGYLNAMEPLARYLCRE